MKWLSRFGNSVEQTPTAHYFRKAAPMGRSTSPFSGDSPLISESTGEIAEYMLKVLADAWHNYPSHTELKAGKPDLKADMVLDMFCRDGLFDRTGDFIRLTEQGRLAMGQASWSNKRLSEFLETRDLPSERTEKLSLFLAIVRAHFQARQRSGL